MELIDVHIGCYGRFELSVVFFFSFFFYFAPVRERKLIMHGVILYARVLQW